MRLLLRYLDDLVSLLALGDDVDAPLLHHL